MTRDRFSASPLSLANLISSATRMPAAFKAAARARACSSTRASLAVSVTRIAPPSGASLAFLASLTAAATNSRAEFANGSGMTWRNCAALGGAGILRRIGLHRGEWTPGHDDQDSPVSRLGDGTGQARIGGIGRLDDQRQGIACDGLADEVGLRPWGRLLPRDRDLQPDLVQSGLRPAAALHDFGLELAPRGDDQLEGPGPDCRPSPAGVPRLSIRPRSDSGSNSGIRPRPARSTRPAGTGRTIPSRILSRPGRAPASARGLSTERLAVRSFRRLADTGTHPPSRPPVVVSAGMIDE